MPRVGAIDCGTNSIRLLVADVDLTRDAAPVMSRPVVAMPRGETWLSRWRATTVPAVMASANGRNASPASVPWP